MNLNLRLALPSLLLLWCCTGFAAPDAQALLKQSDRARGGGLPGIVWEIRLVSRDGDKVSEEQRLQVRATDQASLAEVVEPARSAGTKLLQVERNMWLSKPGLSKPIPISPRQRMSGQASNGDIAATNYAGDYEALPAGTETLGDEACHVLDLSAKHKRTTYDKIRYWISVKRGVGVKAEFYSLSGKLIKSARFDYDNTIEFESQRIPFVSRMVIRDALVDAGTTMEFGAAKVKKVAASEFDLGQMQ
ncbi:MAG: outer membrane lipoprotein-sorting protein [Betaproteobacteria bacterium]|nr:outer membrane lipoprotein-sorting protein [Betaproteobacteria bacterium]